MDKDLISREWLEDAFDNLCCHNCKICRNFRIEDSFYKCALIDNAPPADIKPFANVIFDKDELSRLVDEKVVKAIKSGELVVKTEGEWIPVSKRLPEGKIDSITNDFEPVLCSTIWDDVRPYKYGKPIGHDKAHFWSGGGVMDNYVIAWMSFPETYKEPNNE